MTTPPPFEPLRAACPQPWCRMPPVMRCVTAGGRSTSRTHAPRVALSLEMAALADPALDPWFSAEHGHPDWRRALVTGIAGRQGAGEDAAFTAEDFGVPLEAVLAVRAWAAKWPGATG